MVEPTLPPENSIMLFSESKNKYDIIVIIRQMKIKTINITFFITTILVNLYTDWNRIVLFAQLCAIIATTYPRHKGQKLLVSASERAIVANIRAIGFLIFVLINQKIS